MVDQQKMRAPDHDRQQVVDRLRSALEDGRLTMDEYVDRMEAAYQAATYGGVTPLCADLPASSLSSPGRRRLRLPPRHRHFALAQATWPACRRCQDPVDHMAGRGVGQRNRLDPGQRHRRSPGLPLAPLGGRPVRGGAVRRVSRCHAIPAQPTARGGAQLGVSGASH